MIEKPKAIPERPFFSSGPCPKHRGYSVSHLPTKLLGRSHRSKEGTSRLRYAIEQTRHLLGLDADYHIGIVPASDTGAFEMAMWNLLGPKPVDVFAGESFGKGWLHDIEKELMIKEVHRYVADYGEIPDLTLADGQHDIVFCWNGTTSGVCVPNGDFIPENRSGLVLCDATSAIFAMPIDFSRLDVITYSWQKVLGGEAGFGMLILSPRAIERLEQYSPPWPLPKIFRLKKKGKVDWGIFEGKTINTPSMLCLEDYIDSLHWAESLGGLQALIQKTEQNYEVIRQFVESEDWIDFLAREEAYRSKSSVCLKITDPWFNEKNIDEQKKIIDQVADLLARDHAVYDIKGYRDAPPGFRFWAGATVERRDLSIALEWLRYGYHLVRYRWGV